MRLIIVALHTGMAQETRELGRDGRIQNEAARLSNRCGTLEGSIIGRSRKQGIQISEFDEKITFRVS